MLEVEYQGLAALGFTGLGLGKLGNVLIGVAIKEIVVLRWGSHKALVVRVIFVLVIVVISAISVVTMGNLVVAKILVVELLRLLSL